MELRGPREVILVVTQIDEDDKATLAEDEAKNGEAYAELVECHWLYYSTRDYIHLSEKSRWAY